ncbi:hypothetical protein [Flavobacterium psychrophilum]|nr:hypothetical protein [Flavobacterium psychrophilum]GAQ50218.1 hypothetical protein FPK15_contig00176-0001 [Flavobacterium psychrophilum]GEJ29356.1 hypothetical protein FPN182_contig00141-0001 [Flavobacterium psychrophilum]GEJ31160.1 hypothetical protein FPN186_contig00141-0001 [Flavobacterium psychrophilum]GEJ34854.1 hypothetical protein FPN181_contig00131-0001 [Flavobacterium psychrophilum]GEJ35523.1 hypothetical protein FPN185_contig00154-0001 [Flavobacterium psychrophilum]
MKIVKILLDNGTSREVEDIKPLFHFEEKSPENSKHLHQRAYERQFYDFENDIIGFLTESNLEDYAKDHLGLIDEDDVEEKDISDFSDTEILAEIKDRKLNKGGNIITSNFIERFENIVKSENSILLDNLLSELENKLNL